MTNESLQSRPPLRSSLRWGVAIAAIIAAGAHIPIIPDHLHEAPYMGTLFVLLTLACLGLAAVVMVHDIPLVYLAAATVCGLAIVTCPGSSDVAVATSARPGAFSRSGTRRGRNPSRPNGADWVTGIMLWGLP